MEMNNGVINQILESLDEAKKKVQIIKNELAEAKSTENFWDKYSLYLKKNWPLHILELLEKEAPRLKKLREINHNAMPQIEESCRKAKEESLNMLKGYPAMFEQACSIAGISIDRSSQHPKYTLEKGFFRLEVDETKRRAKLSNYEGYLAETPADIEAVVEMINKERKRLLERPYDGSKFLKQLRSQYKAIVKKEKLKDGDSLPIRDITRRLSKNKKGFRTDEFLIDLSRLTEKGPFDIDDRRLDLQQTKDTKQGMLLYGAEKRGYIGFVKFVEV